METEGLMCDSLIYVTPSRLTAENRRMMLNYFPLTEALETTVPSPLKCYFQKGSPTWRMIRLEKAIMLKMEEGTYISSTLCTISSMNVTLKA